MRKFICNLLSVIVFSSCVPQCGETEPVFVPYYIELSFVDNDGNDLLKDAVSYDENYKVWKLIDDKCKIVPYLPLCNEDDGYREYGFVTTKRNNVWLIPNYNPIYHEGLEKAYTAVDYKIRLPYIFKDEDYHILHTFWTVDFGDAMNNTVLEKVVFNEKEVEFSKQNDYYDILLTVDTLPI